MTTPCSPSRPGGYPSDCDVMEGYRTIARERLQHKAVAPAAEPVLAKARNIKLLLLDVDGVLTDGTLLYSGSGEESKAFHTQDGFGIRLLQQAGVEIGIITARESEAVSRRAAELHIRHIHQGAGKKIEVYTNILKKSGMKPFEVAYMGDDWLDLVVLQQVGLSLAPADSVAEVQEVVHYVTSRPGGHGAVRDACNLILTAKGQLTELLQGYLHR